MIRRNMVVTNIFVHLSEEKSKRFLILSLFYVFIPFHLSCPFCILFFFDSLYLTAFAFISLEWFVSYLAVFTFPKLPGIQISIHSYSICIPHNFQPSLDYSQLALWSQQFQPSEIEKSQFPWCLAIKSLLYFYEYLKGLMPFCLKLFPSSFTSFLTKMTIGI